MFVLLELPIATRLQLQNWPSCSNITFSDKLFRSYSLACSKYGLTTYTTQYYANEWSRRVLILQIWRESQIKGGGKSNTTLATLMKQTIEKLVAPNVIYASLLAIACLVAAKLIVAMGIMETRLAVEILVKKTAGRLLIQRWASRNSKIGSGQPDACRNDDEDSNPSCVVRIGAG